MNSLPQNWAISSLGTVANDISYGFTTTSKVNGSGAKLLRITDIQDGKVKLVNRPQLHRLASFRISIASGRHCNCSHGRYDR